MSTVSMTPRRFDSVDKLVDHLDVPLKRIRLIPQPGAATINDALEYRRETGILCELVDGILVEKAMGYYESLVAAVLIGMLRRYIVENGNPGFVLGEAGMVWVETGQMRMPDVSYFSWDHFPGRLLPKGAVLDLTPDWAIEVLSPSNTDAEMARKRREYFNGSAKLVWQVDPLAHTVDVYTAFDQFTRHGEDATLTGAPVLPGFSLSIRQLFELAGKQQ
jgi:Uma2 family endonuclease